MRCKWKKSDLLKLKEKALKINDEVTLENIKMMLDIMENDVDLDKFAIVPENDKINYKKAFETYTMNMEYLPDITVDMLMELFKIEKEFDYFLTRDELTSFNLTNKDLLTLGYDCLKDLRIKRLLKIYEEIIKDENHYLHIVNDDYPTGSKSNLGGVTFYNYIDKKNYICIYKNNSAFDFQTLIHEVLHAYFYKMKEPAHSRTIYYFQELEGRLGNLLSLEYLRKINYPIQANELREFDLKGALDDSYHIYLNDLLFGLSNGRNFNIGAAARTYERETNDKWCYKRDDLTEICSIYGFDVATDLLSYLIVEDIYNLTKNSHDAFEMVRFFKKHDDLETILDLDKYGLTFMDDKFKNVNDLRLQLKKKIS